MGDAWDGVHTWLRKVGGGGKRTGGAEVYMEGPETSQLHANVHAVVVTVSLIDS